MQWDIPHDETHRFLRWGLQDDEFKSWCQYFDAKGIGYEIGGGRDSWTIYKHMLHSNIEDRAITRCCPMDEIL